jgi:hypothetical protein
VQNCVGLSERFAGEREISLLRSDARAGARLTAVAREDGWEAPDVEQGATACGLLQHAFEGVRRGLS